MNLEERKEKYYDRNTLGESEAPGRSLENPGNIWDMLAGKHWQKEGTKYASIVEGIEKKKLEKKTKKKNNKNWLMTWTTENYQRIIDEEKWKS